MKTGEQPHWPKWSREQKRIFEWSPSRSLLRTVRDYQAVRGSSLFARARRKLIVLRHAAWSVATGADIPLNARIGGGLLCPHPNGIVIHPLAQIGVNCLVMQQVTIGTRGAGLGVPTIGNHVDIGAGAKIIGRVDIGDNARIGAGAVVLEDVPAHATAIGNPARIVERAPRVPNPFEIVERAISIPTPAAAFEQCPVCHAPELDVRFAELEYVVHCRSCGTHGPAGWDSFEAIRKWKRMWGERPISAVQWLIVLVMSTVALSVALFAFE